MRDNSSVRILNSAFDSSPFYIVTMPSIPGTRNIKWAQKKIVNNISLKIRVNEILLEAKLRFQ